VGGAEVVGDVLKVTGGFGDGDRDRMGLQGVADLARVGLAGLSLSAMMITTAWEERLYSGRHSPAPPGLRGGQPLSLEGVDVLFAFADVDLPALFDGFDHLRQAVEDPPGLAQSPYVAGAGRVGPALEELLVRGAADLEEQLALFIAVVVDGRVLAVAL
jgi:hypothetical protein